MEGDVSVTQNRQPRDAASGGNRTKVKVLQGSARCFDATRESGFDVLEIPERSVAIHVDGHVRSHLRCLTCEPTACALVWFAVLRHKLRDYFMFFLLGGA